jgi:hypothetical protein
VAPQRERKKEISEKKISLKKEEDKTTNYTP